MPDVKWYGSFSGGSVPRAVTLVNGTNALPSLAFTSDPDTGIYRVGANALGFATGGTLQWQINSSGNLVPKDTSLIIGAASGTSVNELWMQNIIYTTNGFAIMDNSGGGLHRLTFGAPNGQAFLMTTGDNFVNTTGATKVATIQGGTFAPTSGSGSFAGLQINPTINGVSTGTAYALAVYPKTNYLAGGRIRIAGFGTSAGTFDSGTEGVLISTGYAVAGTMTTVDPTTNEFPVSGTVATGYAIYAKSNKFVIAYYNAGNQLRYKTIPLDGASTTWTDSATAP